MKQKTIFTLCLCAICIATHAGDWHYTPLTLSGFNADLVIAPIESPAGSLDSSGHNFYSDKLKARGGLPQRLHGMFSDVPYVLGDFKLPCALQLRADGETTRTISFQEPTEARTLWLLATAAEGAAQMQAIVNYTDGSQSNPYNFTVKDWKTLNYQGTAFWQLGAQTETGTIDSYNYALYELILPVDISRKANSVNLQLTDGQTVAVFAVTATQKEAPASLKTQKDFFISDSHLDTQWDWSVRTTINQYLKNTLDQNFARYEDPASSEFAFNFESAMHHQWFKEYYPDLFERLKKYVSEGRWNPSGGAVDANDVNIPSGESLIRNFLYGNKFFQREFGVEGGRDVMLPDCFGFSWALPTMAAHCGKKYFHTQKLSWGSAYNYGNLPRFARWQGVDGSELLASLKMNGYGDGDAFRKDMSTATDHQGEITSNLNSYGIPAALKYVGTSGDRGGGLNKTTADWFTTSVNGTGSIGVTMGEATAMMDQFFHMGYTRLPVINHGLPMSQHGVGCYTSRTMLKFWNRKGELLGDAAEKASVAAYWLGTLPYQEETFTKTWMRLLWHQFHDDLTGTSINEAYDYSVNDHVLNQLDFSRTLNAAIGGVARGLKTNAQEGKPLVVYNPLSINRTDIVEATVSLGTEVVSLNIVGSDGQTVPSQILRNKNGEQKFIFLATVPPLGYATYYVQPSVEPEPQNEELTISATGMENARYSVKINENGDVSSVIDKLYSNRELLRTPIRLAMLEDESTFWPSWEIIGSQLQRTPKEYVDNEGLEMEVVENGPLRVALKIKRTKAGSTFVQTIRLAAAGASDRIDFVNEVDWQTRERLLKAVFPLSISNSKTSYDLSIGVDVNNNSSTGGDIAMYEFLGHRWADVTNTTNTYGVTILNDCKYGWDKQRDNELRLSLIHTPRITDRYTHQGSQDIGLNRFTYSLMGHWLRWNASTQWEADKLNQPMLAYETMLHDDGGLGESFAFAQVDNSNVAVKALKKAENSDEIIIRFYELVGSSQKVNVTFPTDIASAIEVNGLEEPKAEATFAGNVLTFEIGKFQPKTFAVRLNEPTKSPVGQTELADSSQILDLSTRYNIDIISNNKRRNDSGHSVSFPAELLPDTIEADGLRFLTGPKADGKRNAVRCARQSITLPEGHGATRLYFLASSMEEGGTEGIFYIDNTPVRLHVGQLTGRVGTFTVRPTDHKAYREENTAFTATHSHISSSSSDGIYEYLYMYKYYIDIPEDAERLRLPSNSNVLIYAMTLSDNPNDDTKPASEIVQLLKHTDTFDPDAPVGVESVKEEETISDGNVYDLSGRRASGSQRGIVISQGKKVLNR